MLHDISKHVIKHIRWYKYIGYGYTFVNYERKYYYNYSNR